VTDGQTDGQTDRITTLKTALAFLRRAVKIVSEFSIFKQNMPRHKERVRPIVADVVWSVRRSVTIVSPARTAEPIEMPFGLWTREGPRNYVLDGVQIPHGKRQF